MKITNLIFTLTSSLSVLVACNATPFKGNANFKKPDNEKKAEEGQNENALPGDLPSAVQTQSPEDGISNGDGSVGNGGGATTVVVNVKPLPGSTPTPTQPPPPHVDCANFVTQTVTSTRPDYSSNSYGMTWSYTCPQGTFTPSVEVGATVKCCRIVDGNGKPLDLIAQSPAAVSIKWSGQLTYTGVQGGTFNCPADSVIIGSSGSFSGAVDGLHLFSVDSITCASLPSGYGLGSSTSSTSSGCTSGATVGYTKRIQLNQLNSGVNSSILTCKSLIKK